MTRVLQKLEEETNKNETDIIELDFDKLPAVDEEEIEKMILKEDEKALKTRLWNTLNQDWLTD